MNTQHYDDAWTELLSARRSGNYKQVREAAERLVTEAKILQRNQSAAPYICNHTPDRRGVCTRCGYNASQTPV